MQPPFATGANNAPLGQRGEGPRQISTGPPRGGRGGGGGYRGAGGSRGAGGGRGGGGRGGGGRGRGRGGGRGGRGGRGGGRGGAGRGPPRARSVGSAEEEIRRRKTQMIEDITRELNRLGLEMGNPILEEKMNPGSEGSKLRVMTNVYGVKMQSIPIYRYDITMSANSRKKGDFPVEFTKRSNDDSVVVDRKNMCRLAFKEFVKKYAEVFGENEHALYYDLACILYTLTELPLKAARGDEADKDENIFILGQDDCANANNQMARFGRVKMLVRRVKGELTLGDLSHLTSDTTQQNHSLASFIELATSQSALFDPEEHVIIKRGSSFLMNPDRFGFVKEDGPQLSEGNKYLAIGSHKSVRYIEGPKGRGNKHVGLIVETKKTPFHNCDSHLLDKAKAIARLDQVGRCRPGDIGMLNAQFKTLYVNVVYKDPKTDKIHTREIQIGGVSANTAANHMFDVQGERVTVADYYDRKYGIKLQFPDAPMATAKEKGKINYYPMELCYVKDFQRAQLSQLNSRETANMIRACAVPPKTLKGQIEKNVDALHLHDSPYLEAAQIKITKPLVVEARRLPAPDVVYSDGNVTVNADDGKWVTRDTFLRPASSKKWAIYMIPSGGREYDRNRFNQDHLEQFSKILQVQCRASGMTLPRPADLNSIDCHPDSIRKTIGIAKNEGCDYIFFVTSDAITNLHNHIKACEQEFQIVTQDLKMSNAYDIVRLGKNETVRNIVAKVNEKLGGLNYTVRVRNETVQKYISDGTLFLGLGISHPGAMGNYERARGSAPTVPSVIGYAANMLKDPFDFIGDFVFDEPRRDEKFSTIATIVSNCVARYKENNSQNAPKRLILFRNGMSEGQFAMSLQYEIPLIRHALKDSCAEECKLTVLVSQRAHNIRLFAEPMPEKAEIPLPNGKTKRLNLNIKPGTVIDSQLTHPEQSEFYLNAHTAIQGTTRTPRYTVLADDSKFELDVIEGMCYALAYGHQIINSPTSLPAPAYIALMYAKRGRAIFQIKKDDITERLDDGQINYQAASERLCYSQTELCDQRVNA